MGLKNDTSLRVGCVKACRAAPFLKLNRYNPVGLGQFKFKEELICNCKMFKRLVCFPQEQTNGKSATICRQEKFLDPDIRPEYRRLNRKLQLHDAGKQFGMPSITASKLCQAECRNQLIGL